jgi:hypothetical protein
MPLNRLKFLFFKKSRTRQNKMHYISRKVKLELMQMEGRFCPSAYVYNVSNSAITTITGSGAPGNGSTFSKGDTVQFSVSVSASVAGETGKELTISSSDGSLSTQTISVGSTEMFSCTIESNDATFSINSASFDGKESAAISIATNQEQLKFLGQPLQGATGGSIISTAGQPVTVEVMSPNGSVDTAFNGDVTIAVSHDASAGQNAVLSGTTTVAARGGIATFNNLSLNQPSQAGIEYTLSATLNDGTETFSNGFQVGHTLVFTTQPSNSSSDLAIEPAVVVSVDDPDGSTLDTNYNGAVTLQLGNNPNGSNAQLGGTTTVNAVKGVATFDIIGIEATGAGYTLEASIPEGETATSKPFNIGDYLQFLQQPDSAAAGRTISPAVTVEVLAPDGSPDTTTTGDTITLSIEHDASGQNAALSGTLTEPVNATTGIATFNGLSINDLGSGYTLLAALNTTSEKSATTLVSNGFNIYRPFDLSFSPQPTSTPTGFTMNEVAVDVMVQSTNLLDTAYNGPVTLQINPASDPSNGTALLAGESSVTVDAVNGVAVYNDLSINTEDNGYSLLATLPDGKQQASSNFNITSAAVAGSDVLIFKVQPSNAVLGGNIKTTVVDVDLPNGKIDTAFNGIVNMAIDLDPNGHSHLVGTTTVNAVKGVAVFNNLTIDQSGVGFKLAASLSSSNFALGSPFNITAPATPKPAVISNPVAQLEPSGGNATYTVEAVSSSTPTVQWQESTNGFKTFSFFANGVSTSTDGNSIVTSLTLSGVTNPMNGEQFRAVFTSGNFTTASAPANLTVLVAPQLTKNLVNETTSAGGSATFVATASGTPAPNVKWEESTNGGLTFSAISDSNAIIKQITTGTITTTTLTIASATYKDDQQEFIAVFTNTLGNSQSSPATLTVHFNPIVTLQPVYQKVANGGEAIYTASAIGDPAVTGVQWEVYLPDGKKFTGATASSTYSDIPGGLSSVATIAGIPTSLNGIGFFAIFSAPNASGKGTASVYTGIAPVLVGVPVITIEPQSTEVTSGATVKFMAAASGTPNPTVQWQVSENGGASYTNIPKATSTTLTIQATASQEGFRYRAIFTNSLGTVTTSAAVLTVDTVPTIIDQPISQTVQNGTTANFSALAAGSPNATVQWYGSTDGGATFEQITGATSETFNLSTQASDAGNTYEFYADFTNSIGSTKTDVVDLTIT